MFIGTAWYRNKTKNMRRDLTWALNTAFRGNDKQAIAVLVEERCAALRQGGVYEAQGLVSNEHFEVVPPEQRVELVSYKGD